MDLLNLRPAAVVPLWARKSYFPTSGRGRSPRKLGLCLLVIAVVAACGDSSDPGGGAVLARMPPVDGLPLGPVSCPVASGIAAAADIAPERLPSADRLWSWQQYMVDLGPRFTGSPALKSWHDFIATQLAGAGLSVQREPVPIDWWWHRKWSLKLIQNGAETEVPVASYYPYSGHTPEGGIVADAMDVGTGLPQDFLLADVAGKIAFEQVDLLPTKAALFYADASYVHDPERTLTPLTDFTRMSFSILVPQISLITAGQTGSLTYAKMGGAVGAVIALGVSKANANGQYTPFGGHPGSDYGVPTVYVDRDTGAALKAKIAQGAKLKLELVVDKHKDDRTDDIIATLPGMSDEVIIVNTHTDGTSATEENGALALISLARYFAALPKTCRQRTMVFVLTPGHFHGGIEGDIDRFINKHPEIMAKAVASLTTEHLGQLEWVDDSLGYHPTGLVEPAVFFGSVAPAIQTTMINAVIAEDLQRVIVSRPIAVIYFGLGSALNLHGVPNAAYLTGPHALYSFADNQHLDQLDRHRMAREVRTFARVAAALDSTDTAVLCAGMLPSTAPDIPVPCGSVPAAQ